MVFWDAESISSVKNILLLSKVLKIQHGYNSGSKIVHDSISNDMQS